MAGNTADSEYGAAAPYALPTTLEARLLRPLSALPVPTRVANWAARRGLVTLGQLVRWHPADVRRERNMGRTSIAQVRKLIRDECGVEWEELWARSRAGSSVGGRDLAAAHWDELAGLLPPALLATPLSALPLPTRIFTYAERAGLASVADLVRVREAELRGTRNLGTRSVEEARAVLVKRGAASDGDEVRYIGWDQLASRLPASLLATPLAHLDLPRRMRAFVAREQLALVRDLVAIPRSILARSPNLGRSSIERTWQVLVERMMNPPRAVADYQTFWSLWLDRLASLDLIDRLVLTRRSGISGDARTLREIGEMLGVSRERVRQIESRAIEAVARGGWVDEVCKRLASALDAGALALEELESRDPWFAPLDEERQEAFAFFLERIAGGSFAVLAVEGRAVVAASSRQRLEASWTRALEAVAKLDFPAAPAEVNAAIASATPDSARGLAAIIRDAVDERLHRDEDGRIVAFGSTRGAEVVAFLRRCPQPVTIHEVFAAMGRRVRFPDEVFYFDRGVVGLEAHFPGYAMWKRRLIPICVRILEQDPRQWRVHDLLEAVREEALLPEWFGHWSLAEILRRSSQVRYLGRLRVAPVDAGEGARLHFGELAQRLLVEAGSPLPLEELEQRMTRHTTVSPLTQRLLLLQPPFVQVDEERVGLLFRDVPGGAEAIARFADALERELDQTQQGVTSGALAAFVTRLTSIHARWTIPMARSVARSDGRFQLARGGGVGLSEWDDVRVPRRVDVVAACVEEHGGRAPISAVVARLHAVFGIRIDRRQLGALAYNAGLRMRGNELLRPEPRRPASFDVLPGLPEESRQIFESLVEQPLENEDSLLRALDAHVSLFERAASEGAPVDPAEAASLRERCGSLLARSRQLDERARRLVQAAVRYFLLRDDAESDLNAGGLDDDEAVIAAVELRLAQQLGARPE